ncbi:hypothetical protein Goarm_018167 [Gossypium armourianum]|uniref:C3H1-type domain-containing protein n=1 Tax=Gossypium armourianum TaxID=34283 RepID=A0A7J9IGP5_9ROSI|nr:hypothetical protein [Gossypium armourianum]
MDTRKRGRREAGFNANGGIKKSKPELESLSTGVGSKSKPCTKFFRHLIRVKHLYLADVMDSSKFDLIPSCFNCSTAGCQFGESCHFLHYVPGGYNAVSQMMNLAPAVQPASRNVAATAAIPHGSASAVKTRLCNKFSSPEGCKFGDKCHFAHGEWELGTPIAPSLDDPRSMAPLPGRMGSRMEPPPPSGPAATFGASATAKISVDASLAGAIIGKGGVHSKQICRQTGAKLSIREHESDPSLRNIELEGSFEQIKEASAMVRELISSLGPVPGPAKTAGAHGGQGHPGSNYKTKLCDNFAKGSCTFGERCHFAHGAAELRKSVV